MMKERIQQQMMDSQKELDSQLDGLIDEISIREHAERCQIFQDVAKDILIYCLNTGKIDLPVQIRMDTAIHMAWEFSGKVIEKMRKEYSKTDNMTDDDILKEVSDRGLVADVLFTNEDLVESYGYVKKSETEF